MMDVVESWFRSGKYAQLAGAGLRPMENPKYKGMPLSLVRGQAHAFYLLDDNSNEWILKKFLPAKIPDSAYIRAIQALVPRWPGFQSGYARRVLSKADLSQSGFYSVDFADWIENTVLMPRIKCEDWAAMADKVRSGAATLTDDERIMLCKSLSERIKLLESKDLSHRDLSALNVFVDKQNLLVHLIDWDCIFHPTLAMPPNTTYGSEGYIAAFVNSSGTPDPQATWKPRADRFSMTILNSEFLSMDAGTPLRHEGGMFEQAELFQRGGPETARIINGLRSSFPDAAALLEKALRAQSFDDCPGPDEWLALSNPIRMPLSNPASPSAPSANAQPGVAPQANSASPVLLDEAAFVQLDEAAFVRLM